MTQPDDPDLSLLQTHATTVSGWLRKRFGNKPHYTPGEVEAACSHCQVPADLREYFAVMFLDPAETEGFLQKLGSSKSAATLRKVLAQQVFFDSLPGGGHAESDPFDYAKESPSTSHGSDDGGSDADGGCDDGE